MSYIIRRVTTMTNMGLSSWSIAIIMEFFDFMLVNCIMMLEVMEGEVEHFIKDLFNITVKTVIGVWHLLLGKEVRLTLNTSNPEITLKDIRGKAIF